MGKIQKLDTKEREKGNYFSPKREGMDILPTFIESYQNCAHDGWGGDRFLVRVGWGWIRVHIQGVGGFISRGWSSSSPEPLVL